MPSELVARMPEVITFTDCGAFGVTADRWPATIAVTDELRDGGGVIDWSPPLLGFDVANGSATYEFAHALKNTEGASVYHLVRSEFCYED